MKRIVCFAFALLLLLACSPLANAQQRRPPFPDEPGPRAELLGPEMEHAALKFVETYHPGRLEDLRHAKAAQPERYVRTIMDIWRRTELLKRFEKEDPERYDFEIKQETLDEKTFTLAHAYRNATDEKEKQNLKRQIEVAVSEHFDLREKIKESELKRMEGDLQRLKERLKQRKANKSEIVKQRVSQLMTIGSGLEWD